MWTERGVCFYSRVRQTHRRSKNRNVCANVWNFATCDRIGQNNKARTVSEQTGRLLTSHFCMKAWTLCLAVVGFCDLPAHFGAFWLWEEYVDELHSDAKSSSSLCRRKVMLPEDWIIKSVFLTDPSVCLLYFYLLFSFSSLSRLWCCLLVIEWNSYIFPAS